MNSLSKCRVSANWVSRGLAIAATTVVVAALAVPVVNAAPPDAPTALTGTASNLQVALTWTAPSASPALSDYIVEYSSDNGATWTQSSRTASTTASQTVTGLTNSVSYRFRVSAINADGQSAYSNVASAVPVPTHTKANLPTFSACPTAVITSAGFSDVVSTSVDCIKYYGITLGTTATTYSPLDSVSRWQMALFLTRMASVAGATLGDGSDQGFTDISGESAEIQTAINQIKQLGITVGTTATTYSPADYVTREQMALFISRLLKKATVGPGGNTEFVSGISGAKEIKSNDTDHNFTDLTGDGSILLETLTAIKSLWNLGVAVPTTGTLYEPQKKMNRLMMATFMTNALHHTNARPAGLVLQADTYRSAGTPTISMSVTHRTSGFAPIVGTTVDTFYFLHSVDTTINRFSTTGTCDDVYPSAVGSLVCKVESGDPVTDANGNLALFTEVMSANSTKDFWAWTAAANSIYDNDIHASDASKITIESVAS